MNYWVTCRLLYCLLRHNLWHLYYSALSSGAPLSGRIHSMPVYSKKTNHTNFLNVVPGPCNVEMIFSFYQVCSMCVNLNRSISHCTTRSRSFLFQNKSRVILLLETVNFIIQTFFLFHKEPFYIRLLRLCNYVISVPETWSFKDQNIQDKNRRQSEK